MRRDSSLFALSLLGVTGGLGVLLFGEQFHYDALIYVGGVFTLFSVGIITFAIDQMESPQDESSH